MEIKKNWPESERCPEIFSAQNLFLQWDTWIKQNIKCFSKDILEAGWVSNEFRNCPTFQKYVWCDWQMGSEAESGSMLSVFSKVDWRSAILFLPGTSRCYVLLKWGYYFGFEELNILELKNINSKEIKSSVHFYISYYHFGIIRINAIPVIIRRKWQD